jgi:hypothetical protein
MHLESKRVLQATIYSLTIASTFMLPQEFARTSVEGMGIEVGMPGPEGAKPNACLGTSAIWAKLSQAAVECDQSSVQ